MRDIEISPAFAIRSRSGEGNPMIQKSSVDGGIYFRSEELGVGSWELGGAAGPGLLGLQATAEVCGERGNAE